MIKRMLFLILFFSISTLVQAGSATVSKDFEINAPLEKVIEIVENNQKELMEEIDCEIIEIKNDTIKMKQYIKRIDKTIYFTVKQVVTEGEGQYKIVTELLKSKDVLKGYKLSVLAKSVNDGTNISYTAYTNSDDFSSFQLRFHMKRVAVKFQEKLADLCAE